MLPGITRVGIVIDFKMHQEFIASVLCINKDIPTSTCNGQCYLARQLSEQDNKQEQQATAGNRLKLEVLYCLRLTATGHLRPTESNSINWCAGVDNDLHTSCFAIDVFHPPQYALI